jgi:hypothetical protein
MFGLERECILPFCNYCIISRKKHWLDHGGVTIWLISVAASSGPTVIRSVQFFKSVDDWIR